MSLTSNIDLLGITSPKISEWVNGGVNTTVLMGGIPVRSPAKLISDLEVHIMALTTGPQGLKGDPGIPGLKGDPGTSSTGTVSTISVVPLNGIIATISTPTTTPVLNLSLGDITPTSVAATGTVTGSNLSGSNSGDNAINNLYAGLVSNATHTGDAIGNTALTVVAVNGVHFNTLGTGILKNTTTTGLISIAVAADFPILNQNTTGSSASASIAASLAGGAGGSIPYQLASGNTAMLLNGTSGQLLQSNGTTLPPSWITLTIGNAQTTSPLSQFALTTSAQLGSIITDKTGLGVVVYNNNPTLISPVLGTPQSGNLAQCTFPILNQNTTGTASNVTGTVGIANGGTGLISVGGAGQLLAVNPGGTGYVFVNPATLAGTGTVTSVSINALNGVSGVILNATTTPTITFTLGAITPTSVAATGTVTGSNLSGTNTGDQINITGNAGTATLATTATNIAGGLGGQILYQSGAGVTAKVLNGTTGQVLQSNGTTLAPSWITLTGGGNAQTANPLSQFALTTSAQLSSVISDKTGTGVLVFGTSPNFTTPVLGTPASGNLVNCTGFPTNSVTSTLAATATNIAGGAAGSIPYQSAAGTTAMILNGTAGYILQSNGTTLAPSWVVAPTGTGGAGTVTSVSVLNANGVSAVVSTPTAAASLTFTLGAITPSSVAATGAVTGSNLSGTNTGDQVNITGNAGTATNLAGGVGGQVHYQSGVGVTSMLPNGTVGQVLQSNGTTLAPSWVSGALNPRIVSITTTTTAPVNADITDLYEITALGSACTFAAPTGTPVNGQCLMYRIMDVTAARALAFNIIFSPAGVTLPTTTVLGKWMHLAFIYNSNILKWQLIGLSQEA